MAASKVVREQVKKLTDLPNIGKRCAEDPRTVGIHAPSQLVGSFTYELYEALCAKAPKRHYPCMIDVFLSVAYFMRGEAPQAWWGFTPERKEYPACRASVSEVNTAR
jgi:hypothetical protein